jgi:hypothetical protein
MRLLDYLRPRLFEPLGIANPHWEVSPQDIDVGGWGLMITTSDIAAFGQLYVQQGHWQGRQLIPESWVAAASARQISNGSVPNSDWEQGYGYQFWRCRHDAYRGDGAFGQYCVVMPAQDAVLAITSGLGDMQRPLDLVWEHLLPAMGAAPLPEDEAAQTALAGTLARLQLHTPQGGPDSPVAARVSGKRFIMDENKGGITEVRFDFGTAETLITHSNAQGDLRIACGHNRWVNGTSSTGPHDTPGRPSTLPHFGPWKISASGAWTDDTTYTVKLWWYETPFARTLTYRFAGDRLTLEQQNNVGFEPPERVQLQGHLDEQA